MKKFASLCLSFLLGVSTLLAWDFKYDNAWYNITSTTACTVEIANGSDLPSYYAIPSTVCFEGTPYTVTAIGDSAFSNSSITTVFVPQTVTKIGSFAFYYSKLESITLPNTIQIVGAYAFDSTPYYTSLYRSSGNFMTINDYILLRYNNYSSSSVYIPENIRVVAGRAFSGNSSITYVSIPDSVISIGDEAFSGCSNLADFTMSSNIQYFGRVALSSTAWENKNVDFNAYSFAPVYIANYILYGFKGNIRSNQTVTLRSGTRVLAGCAFNIATAGNYGLTVNLPSTVAYIHDETFSQYPINAINVDSYNPWFSSADGVLFNSNKTVLIAYPKLKSGNYDIPETVREIGYGAFCNAYLTSVTLPQSLLKIGNMGFAGSQIESVEMSDNIRFVDNATFFACYSLKSARLSSRLTTISQQMFNLCNQLEEVTGADNALIIGRYAFTRSALKSFRIPSTVERIYDGAFASISTLNSLTLGWENPGYCDIASDAFNGVDREQCSVSVPRGTLSLYASHPLWSEFLNLTDGCKGDIDGDGQLTVSDITTLIDLILSDTDRADVDINSDGTLTVSDITALINLMLK